MAEELTTRSPRVADRSLCLLPTDVIDSVELDSLVNKYDLVSVIHSEIYIGCCSCQKGRQTKPALMF